MNAGDPLSRVHTLYHFTDRRNLALVTELGGLYPMSDLKDMGVTVPAPGGNDWSRDADALKGMEKYVHLCFRPSHPMEYLARAAGRIDDTIFLQVHPEVLSWDGVLYTPDVANKSGVPTHTMAEARDLIDLEVLYTWTNWKDPEIQARLQRAEKAEILVPRRIPLELIRNLPSG